jgi:hypothetical protein
MRKKVLLLLYLLPLLHVYGGEGMWLLNNLSEQTKQLMKELGLEIPVSQIYSADQPCLENAIVSFGGFCSGVVVSEDGLIFTNHHCGFDAIQQHSTVEHDYLKDGFVAHNHKEELPNPDLYVSFLVHTEDVTQRILSAVTDGMKEQERRVAVDSMMMLIQDEYYQKDSLLRYVITPFYSGNEFYLSVYKDYNDVRLVFAPPSSVGKFGWDTDNWVWPRHTGDFSVFRIYADKNNEPAEFSPENVPYHPDYVAPISLQGYEEGSYCMTIGYPGTTERYLSSFGVRERMEADNTAMIEIRTVKQAIWKNAMESSDSIRIKYASKYATSSNYWKNSIGMNKAITDLHVIEKKQLQESNLKYWIQENPDERNKYIHVLTDLQLNYRNRKDAMRALAFFREAFLNSSELISLALGILNFDFDDSSENVDRNKKELESIYADFDPSIDKEVFVAMLKAYKNEVNETYLPEIYSEIKKDYNNDYRKYADNLFSHSELTTPKGFQRLLERDSTFVLFEDPAAQLALDLLVKYFDLNQLVESSSMVIEQGERLLNVAIREMDEERNFYPDANSTMRMSFGVVGGYSPKNAVQFKYFTTTKGIIEKIREYKGDPDFYVEPALQDLLEKKDFGRYADSTGEMNVCFISDNDITGGNSGSGMFNGKGELMGLAFDGNWEAMSGDIIFEPKLQRCIGVDIRYVLYIIEKYGKASHLIQELQLR